MNKFDYRQAVSKASNSNIGQRLVRDDLKDMVPYQSARREVAGGINQHKTWLNANESGGSDSLDMSLADINRYPDFQPQALIQAYAHYAKLASDHILATRGADEGIDVLIRTFCRASADNIIICPPTYGMYSIAARSQNAGIISVPLKETDSGNMALDIAGLTEHINNARLVFICSPNNPTGGTVDLVDIIEVLNLYQDTALVVIDEAYIEYCPDTSVVSLLQQYPNLVVLRTLSKAFALAGLRCGFVLAHNNVIEQLSKVIAPYPIATPVATIASQALMNVEIMTQRVEQTIDQRKTLEAFLDQQPWLIKRYQSNTNYVLFKAQDASTLYQYFLEQGVVIRDQSKQLGLSQCLRVSVGTADEMQQFYNACLRSAGEQVLAAQSPNNIIQTQQDKRSTEDS
ncbi:histidinol-phosphate transaminase [Thalassotalea maritima]|uniref:histidinol-phosphate transaminase n=1 Tax=Thalassotalea maritima TaxID=3242416 RepID=UPI0035270404